MVHLAGGTELTTGGPPTLFQHTQIGWPASGHWATRRVWCAWGVVRLGCVGLPAPASCALFCDRSRCSDLKPKTPQKISTTTSRPQPTKSRRPENLHERIKTRAQKMKTTLLHRMCMPFPAGVTASGWRKTGAPVHSSSAPWHPLVVRSPCQENDLADAHPSGRKTVLESANPAWSRIRQPMSHRPCPPVSHLPSGRRSSRSIQHRSSLSDA